MAVRGQVATEHLAHLLYRIKNRLEHDVLQALEDAKTTDPPHWDIEIARSHCQHSIEQIAEDPVYQYYEKRFLAARDRREAVHDPVPAAETPGAE